MIGKKLGHFEITGKLGEGGIALHLAVNWPAILEEQ